MAYPPITRVSNLQSKSDNRNKNKGIYFDDITTVQRDAIPTKTNGLTIFNEDTDNLQVYINAAWSNLSVQGGISVLKRTATAVNYQVLATDNLIAVTDTSVARTITLPLIATVAAGQIFIVKDEGNGATANPITVNGNGANINGAASQPIAANYAALRVYSTGTVWFTF